VGSATLAGAGARAAGGGGGGNAAGCAEPPSTPSAADVRGLSVSKSAAAVRGSEEEEEEVDDGKVSPPADADASRACRLTMLRARSALRIRCAGAGAESVDAVNSSAAAVRKSVSSAR